MALSDSALEEFTRPKGMEGPKTIEDLLAAGEAYKDTGPRFDGMAQRTIGNLTEGKKLTDRGMAQDFIGNRNLTDSGMAQRTIGNLIEGKKLTDRGMAQDFIGNRNPTDRGGISAMQETDYSSRISPEQIEIISNGAKNAILQSDEMSPEEKQQAVGSMSSSNTLELIEQIFTEASKIPDEEVSSMPLEVEAEAEGYIDEILGGGTAPENFWAAGGEQYKEAFDPNKPMESVLYSGPLNEYGQNRDEKGYYNKRPVNTNARTLFDAYQDQNDPSMKTITTGKVTTTVPVALSHMQHVNAHLQQLLGTYTGGKLLDMVEEGSQDQEMIIDAISKMGGGAMDKFNQLGNPEDINFSPTGMNYGGPVQSYNRGGLASMGRMEDTELAHVAPGERIVPEWILGDKGEDMLDAAFIRAGIDPVEYTVGSGQGSINPRTGMPEYTSFFKRLLKKVKKVAPIIGGVIGFSMGGNIGAGIGKAIGGVIKTGDLDFQNALTDFGTGWAMGNFATGMGMQGNRGVGSIFKPAAQGGMWGWGSTPNIQHTIAQGETPQSVADKYGISEQELIEANPTSTGRAGSILEIPKLESSVGGFIQQSGAKLAGALGGQGAIDPKTKNPYEFGLVEQFKNLPMGKKLGVGALGLAALSQTGMFDKEQRGEIPENITQGMQGLENYVNEPLRAYNPQPVWGQNAPLINIPQTQSAVSPFMTTRAPSLSETLSDLSNNRIGLDFPSFNPG